MIFLSEHTELGAKTGHKLPRVMDSMKLAPKPTLLTTQVVNCLPRLGGHRPSQAAPWSGEKSLQSKGNEDTLPAPQGTSRPELSALFACTALWLCSNSKPDCCIVTSCTPKPSGKAETFWHLNVRENAFGLGLLFEEESMKDRGPHHPWVLVRGCNRTESRSYEPHGWRKISYHHFEVKTVNWVTTP